MKCIFAADLHGKENLYDQLTGYVKSECPKVLILGGDLLPEPENILETARFQKEYVEHQLRSRMTLFRDLGVERILVILGNHDMLIAESGIRGMEEAGICEYIHGKSVEVETLSFVGYSYSPPSPYWLRDFDKRDLPDEPVMELCMREGKKNYVSRGQDMIEVDTRELFSPANTIKADLAKLADLFPCKKCIFVCHAPPLCDSLDLETETLHVGSKAVRQFITDRKPLLSLHGHIHFSPKNSGRFTEMIGGVPCVQPGQKFSDLYGVFFDTDDIPGTLRHTVIQQKD